MIAAAQGERDEHRLKTELLTLRDEDLLAKRWDNQAQYLDRTSDHTVLMRRLDATSRQLTRASRDNNILAEAFATFVHIGYAYTAGARGGSQGQGQGPASGDSPL